MSECLYVSCIALRKAHPVHDRGVDEPVGDQDVLVGEDRLEDAGVRVEAGGKRIVSSVPRNSVRRPSSSRWMSCVPQMKRTDDMP